MSKRIWFTKEKFQKIIDEQIRDYSGLGGNVSFGLIFLFLFVVGYAQENAIMFKAARVLLVSGLLFTLVGFGLKYALGRTRPNQVSLKWASVFDKMNDASFPSIHSGRAIIMGYVVGPLFPGYGKFIFYIAMLGIPLTRIIMKKHYWSDVIAGALLGFLIAYGVNLVI